VRRLEMQSDRSNKDLRSLLPVSLSERVGGPHPYPRFFRYLIFGVSFLGILLVLLAAYGSDHLPRAQARTGAVTELEEIDLVVRSELPLEVNDRIDRWVHRYLGADRATFEMYLVRQGLYATMIREKLRERGMPAELLYIPMIESAFNPDAISEVSATGMWQFMEPTARAYGLLVNESIDERRDPVRATDAALDYLQELYGIFGSWPLAVAAYNAGPETIRQALRRSGGSEGAWKEDLFWKIRDELPLKNREYLPKLLAVALISQNIEHFGFREVEPLRPYEFEGVLVPGGTTLAAVARSLNIPLQALRDLNPHLLQDAAPAGAAHLMRVPPGEGHDVAMALPPVRTSRRGD